jgi:hypothetical protein
MFRWLFCTEGSQNVESGHNQYDPKTGTKVDGASFNVNYGSGYASGDVYTDKVTVGGITVTQAVECATSVDSGSTKVNYGYPQPSSATTSALNSGMLNLLYPLLSICSILFKL